MNKLQIITRITWLIAGILTIVALSLAINITLNVQETASDMRQLSAQVTVEDLRQVLDIMEKELDTQILELEIEKQRIDTPLSFTPENWQAFLDFCGRTGYVVSDRNWQEYRYGRLK